MFEHIIEDCQCEGKRCTKCEELLCHRKFSKNPKGSKGLRSDCKKCAALVSKSWRNNNKEYNTLRNKKYHKATGRGLRRKYHMTIEEWVALCEKQNGLCAICRKVLDKGKLTHVDHCHATGKIRGILCSKCNNGLGFFGDNPDNLQRAYQYLVSGS
jgi:Recombination endonuclease VII